MFIRKIRKGLGVIVFVWSGLVLAKERAPHPVFVPTSSAQAVWVFSGMVKNEAQERLGFYFRVERDGGHLKATAILIDKATQKMVLHETREKQESKVVANQLSIGDAFLRFNPINDRWIIGIKRKDNTGFSFKIDMLKPDEAKPIEKNLARGVSFYVTQTSSVNGHIQLTPHDKEQFVTAPRVWFFQSWLKEAQDTSAQLSGMFCQLYDGNGFYAVRLKGKKSLQAILAGWLDSQEKPSTMSQFVSLAKAGESAWTLDVSVPKHHYVIKNDSKDEAAYVGFIEQGGQGFCSYTEANLD